MEMNIYFENIPEHYTAPDEPSITIHCKDSQRGDAEYMALLLRQAWEKLNGSSAT